MQGIITLSQLLFVKSSHIAEGIIRTLPSGAMLSSISNTQKATNPEGSKSAKPENSSLTHLSPTPSHRKLPVPYHHEDIAQKEQS